MHWKDLEVIGPRVLVQMDEEPEFFSGTGLVKPGTVHETAEIEGTVLKVGTGTSVSSPPGRVPIADIEEGDKVCFIKFHSHFGESPQIQHKFGDRIFLIALKDILYVKKQD